MSAEGETRARTAPKAQNTYPSQKGILSGPNLSIESIVLVISAEGEIRTLTGLATLGILSPVCLPFHHPGMFCGLGRLMDHFKSLWKFCQDP